MFKAYYKVKKSYLVFPVIKMVENKGTWKSCELKSPTLVREY